MALSELPTPAEIRIASRLLPEQVSTHSLASDADLEADISDRIDEQAAYVEMRLGQAAAPRAYPLDGDYLANVYPNYTESQIDAVTVRQASVAKQAVKLLTLADLFDSAGQLNERYQVEASGYRTRGEALLEQLVTELQWQIAQYGDESESDGISMLTIAVGENFPSDEYSA